jgi:hypothetical protein
VKKIMWQIGMLVLLLSLSIDLPIRSPWVLCHAQRSNHPSVLPFFFFAASACLCHFPLSQRFETGQYHDDDG